MNGRIVNIEAEITGFKSEKRAIAGRYSNGSLNDDAYATSIATIDRQIACLTAELNDAKCYRDAKQDVHDRVKRMKDVTIKAYSAEENLHRAYAELVRCAREHNNSRDAFNQARSELPDELRNVCGPSAGPASTIVEVAFNTDAAISLEHAAKCNVPIAPTPAAPLPAQQVPPPISDAAPKPEHVCSEVNGSRFCSNIYCWNLVDQKKQVVDPRQNPFFAARGAFKDELRALVYQDGMTLRKLDYLLYLNAREWMNSVGITVDKGDASMMTNEAVIDTTGRDMPVIIRGFRPGPLFPTQMISRAATKGSKPKRKTKSSATEEPDDVAGGAKKKTVSGATGSPEEKATDGHPFIFVIAPESNPFSKMEDIARITTGIPMDGTHEVVLASAIVAPQLAGFPFIRNIRHSVLAYNPLKHSSAPIISGALKIEVIRDPERIKKEVLYDTLVPDLGGLAKMRAATDPYVFWLDAHPGEVVRYTMNAEDTCVQTEYRHVV